MEVDGDYPEEISSSSVNQLRTVDLQSPTKKRKFLAENKEQLQASKYIRSETFVESSTFSDQSVQAKLFYGSTRKGKMPSQEMANQEDSAQDSNSTSGDSSFQCSDTKSGVYAKVSSYDQSSSPSSHSGGAAISRDASCSMDSSTMVDEFQGYAFYEGNVDEFGHCLEYLAAACEGENETGDRDDDGELLYPNAMSCRVPSECLTTEVTQLNMGKATIDQEFEQYFSMLML